MDSLECASEEEKHQCTIHIMNCCEQASECIYLVPKKLRKINEEAYTPQLISIGPFHHHRNVESSEMQKHKKRFYDECYNRINDKKKFDELKNFVREHEKCIRNCYSDQASELPSEEFVEVILNDAVFIIMLFLKNVDDKENDRLLVKPWLTKAIKLDLLLLENQLPYFVLEELYKLILRFDNRNNYKSHTFFSLSRQFFKYKKSAGEPNKKIHFLDMKRYTMVESLPEPESSGVKEDFHNAMKLNESMVENRPKSASSDVKEDFHNAVKLNESGVRFKAMHSVPLLHIEFVRRRKYSHCFHINELQIPRITIEDDTECLFRNLMALEQCHYPRETHICNYIDLIDCLIDTKKDVDLLVEEEIVSNRVGDHAAISQMFNKLCLQIVRSDDNNCYSDLRSRLKKHHDRWWNRTKAALVSVYFRDVWRGTGTTAAAILLLLTVLQTMQRLWGGWTPPRK